MLASEDRDAVRLNKLSVECSRRRRLEVDKRLIEQRQLIETMLLVVKRA